MTLFDAPQKCLNQLFANDTVYRATAYIAANLIVKATRQFKPDKRDRKEYFLVTVGVPNYAERHFIKQFIKAGERFPVKKIQLKFYPQTKKKAA